MTKREREHDESRRAQPSARDRADASRANENGALLPDNGSVSQALERLQRSHGNSAVGNLLDPSGRETGRVPSAIRDLLASTRGAGRSLSPHQREQMQPAFDRPLDDVRLHSGTDADTLARAFDARAFTTGSDVYFRREASDGDTGLLAHELAHVVQDDSPIASGNVDVSHPADISEIEAEAAAERVKQGFPANVRPRRGSAIRRQPMAGLELARGLLGPKIYEAEQQGIPFGAEDALFLPMPSIYGSFPGAHLTPDPTVARGWCERIVAGYGKNELHSYAGFLTIVRSQAQQRVYEFRQRAVDDPNRPTQKDKDEAELKIKIIDVFEAQSSAFETEITKYLHDFQIETAEVETVQLLNDAQELAELQEERYGLSKTKAPATGTYKEILASAIMKARQGKPTDDIMFLGATAAVLARRLTTIKTVRGKLEPINEQLWNLRILPLEDSYSRGPEFEALEKQAKPILAELKTAVSEYYVDRNAAEIEHPVLAEWAQEFDLELPYSSLGGLMDLNDVAKPVDEGKLKGLVEMQGGGMGTQLTAAMKIIERLRDIDEFRNAVKDDSEIVWQFDTLLDRTKTKRGLVDGTWQSRVVKDYAHHRVLHEHLMSLGLGVLSAVLGLLAAPFTGGTSVVIAGAGVGVSGYAYYRELEAFRIHKAATGTAFDKAQAIALSAPDEPSMFWFAVDVVSGGFDMAVGAKKFMEAVKAKREFKLALKAGDAASIASTEKALLSAGTEFNAGPRLVQDARHEQAKIMGGAEDTVTKVSTTIIKGEHRTMTQPEAAEMFERFFGKPGPPPNAYVVHATREDYARAIGHDPTQPMPGGMYMNGRIHLMPDSPHELVMHEALHWLTESKGASREMGAFLDEGLVDWIATRHLGPHGILMDTYRANIQLTEQLVDLVGRDVVEAFFLNYSGTNFARLKVALENHLGGADNVEEFFRLLKGIDAYGQPATRLTRAKSMLPGGGAFARNQAARAKRGVR